MTPIVWRRLVKNPEQILYYNFGKIFRGGPKIFEAEQNFSEVDIFRGEILSPRTKIFQVGAKFSRGKISMQKFDVELKPYFFADFF